MIIPTRPTHKPTHKPTHETYMPQGFDTSDTRKRVLSSHVRVCVKTLYIVSDVSDVSERVLMVNKSVSY